MTRLVEAEPYGRAVVSAAEHSCAKIASSATNKQTKDKNGLSKTNKRVAIPLDQQQHIFAHPLLCSTHMRQQLFNNSLLRPPSDVDSVVDSVSATPKMDASNCSIRRRKYPLLLRQHTRENLRPFLQGAAGPPQHLHVAGGDAFFSVLVVDAAEVESLEARLHGDGKHGKTNEEKSEGSSKVFFRRGGGGGERGRV